MIICPYCGNEIPEGSRFCSECGKELPLPSEGGKTEKLSPLHGKPQEKRRKSRIDDSYLDEEEAEYFREDKRTVMVGVILASLICVFGIGLYFIVTVMLSREPEKVETSGLGDKMVQVETTVTPVPQEEAAPENEEEQTEEQPEEQPAEIQAAVTVVDPEQLSAYVPVGISASLESSYLIDDGTYHYSSLMLDGREETSWQEASEGDGTGEWAQFGFDRPYMVKYITFKMGNWRNSDMFYSNNRPQTIRLQLDDRYFELTFQDGQMEQTVEFSEPCPASGLNLQILSVYGGSRWNDCCIAEMRPYGM